MLETDVAEAYRVDAQTISKYPAVFYLQQIADAPRYGPAGPGGPPFPEAQAPAEAEVVFQGRYFRLAKSSAKQGRPDLVFTAEYAENAEIFNFDFSSAVSAFSAVRFAIKLSSATFGHKPLFGVEFVHG